MISNRHRVIVVLSLALATACVLVPPRAGTARAADEPKAEKTATEGEASKDPNPLAIDADLAVWTAVVFLVLFFVLAKFAWGPIAAALDKREQHISDNIAAARQRDEDSRKLLAEYEQKLSGAADEVRAMLEEARRDAEGVKQQIVTEAKTAAHAESERAMREIRTATDAAVEQLSERSADLAVTLAGKIVSAKLTSEERSKLVQDSLAKFAAAAQQELVCG